MKKLTKVLALLISIITVLGMIACSDTPIQSDDTTAAAAVTTPTASETSAEETKLKANLPDKKYDRDFNIASGFVTDTKYTSSLITSAEITGDILNDAFYNRTVLMEETFGIKMNVVDCAPDKLKTAHSSGERIYDIGTGVLSEVTLILSNGLAVDLNTVTTIDLSMPWWDQNANAKFMVTDKLFYTFSDFLITGIDNCRACYFNKELATDLNLGDLYGMAKEGSWTLEKFRQMCIVAKSDLNGDSKIDTNDRIGVGGAPTQFYEAIMSGCDMEPVKQGDGNIPYYSANVEREKFIEVYTTVLDYFTKDDTYLSAGNTEALDMFKAGNALFSITTFTQVPKLRAEAAIEFGIMPIPKYNADQKNYQHTSPNGDALFICPGSAEDIEFAGVMCEAGSYFSSIYYSENAVMPSYFDLCLTTKNAPDVESSENLQIIHDSISYTMKILGTDYMQGIYNLLAAEDYNVASRITQFDKLYVKQIKTKLKAYGIEIN